MKMSNTFFCCFEGLDGSGKSTQSKLLYEAFKNLYEIKKDVVLSRQPGGTAVGESIRNCIMQSKPTGATTIALMRAAQIDYSKAVLEDNRSKIVISDRWEASTYAYNVRTEQEHELFNELHKYSAQPNVYIYLDTDPEVAYKRVMKSRGIENFLDDVTFTEYKLRSIKYKEYLAQVHSLVINIDATQSVDTIHQQILKNILNLI